MRRAPLLLLAFAALWLTATASAAVPAGDKAPPPPAPDFPAGCEPELIRSRLASPDSADVARACGNLRMPWGYRGWIGRQQSLRSYGRRVAGTEWARNVVTRLLDSAAVDTIYRVPGLTVSCRPSEGSPIYLVRLHRGGQTTSVLLRFDLGIASVFADEAPLGMLALGGCADSLWAMLAEVLEDDPALQRPRPAPAGPLLAAPHVTGEAPVAETPPTQIGRGRELPEYPRAARRQGIQGTVHVLVRVDANGMVEDAVVHAGPIPLRAAALETVWGFRFRAAHAGGKPVAAWTMVPVSYTLHH